MRMTSALIIHVPVLDMILINGFGCSFFINTDRLKKNVFLVQIVVLDLWFPC